MLETSVRGAAVDSSFTRRRCTSKRHLLPAAFLAVILGWMVSVPAAASGRSAPGWLRCETICMAGRLGLEKSASDAAVSAVVNPLAHYGPDTQYRHGASMGRGARNRPWGPPRHSVATPLQLRSALLYSEREFSTFIRHPTVTSAAPFETGLVHPPLERRTEDRWIAFDKVQHLTFSFLWTLGTQYVVVNKGLTSEERGLPISITSSALVGVAKEVYDLRIGPTNYFSYRDLIVDGVGILLAVGVIVL